MTASAPAGSVRGVDFIQLPAADLDRARHFYEHTLGLEAGPVWQRPGSPALGAEFETGTTTIALMDVAAIGREFSVGASSVALRVDDVAAERARLESAGVSFAMDTIDSGVCLQAIFADSEGNTLILHHRYAATV